MASQIEANKVNALSKLYIIVRLIHTDKKIHEIPKDALDKIQT